MHLKLLKTQISYHTQIEGLFVNLHLTLIYKRQYSTIVVPSMTSETYDYDNEMCQKLISVLMCSQVDKRMSLKRAFWDFRSQS